MKRSPDNVLPSYTMFPRCRALLLLTLQTCVFGYVPCGGKKNVFAVEGEDVTLRVEEKEVTEISWVFKSVHIATTKPDDTVDIKNRNYKTKLYTERRGSLGIARISMEDNGTYTASIFKEDSDCSQSYDLTVYSNFSSHDLEIHHNVSGVGSCFITCVVKKPDVTTTWRSVNTSDKETTSTLHLDRTGLNVTRVCTAANNVMNASKMIEPWTLCFTDPKRLEKDKTARTLTIVIVVLVILGAVCGWCLIKRARKMPCSTCKRKPKNRTLTEDFQEERIYHEIKEGLQGMTVGHKTKEDVESRQTPLNTVYSTLYIAHTGPSENFLAVSS